MYDAIASAYNELHGDEQLRKISLISSSLEIRNTDKVLDVGCGTGLSGGWLKGRVEEITGVEPSSELAKQCPYKTVISKGESLPFPDKSFDVVLCVSALHNFDDFLKGLDEIRRVMIRSAVITVLKKSAKCAEMEMAINETFSITDDEDDPLDKIFICGLR